MTNPTGELVVQARGKSYRLHFGFSVIADLQARFGDRFEAILNGVTEEGKLPDMKVAVEIFLGSLQRYHADEADRWLVDDIISADPHSLTKLLSASSSEPEEGSSEGNAEAAA